MLTRYCAGCHNTTDAEAGFSVQSASGLRKGSDSGPVLDTMRPDQGTLYKVLTSTADNHMPPLDEAQPTAAELKSIQEWILAGARFDGAATSMLAVPAIKPRQLDRPSAVFSMAVFSDGVRRSEGLFRSVRISSREGVVSATLPIEGGKVTDLLVEPGSETLLVSTGVAGFSGRAIRLDIDDGSVLTEFTGHSDVVYAVAESPDRSMVATAGYDRRIAVYDSATGELLRVMNGHNGAIFDLAFSPDGNILASASADGTIKVWDPHTGERLDTLSQPQAEQYACVFSPDGNYIFAAGADNRIRQWKVESRGVARINPLVEARFAHESVIHSLVISADGTRLATAADDGTLKIWDAGSLTQIASHARANDLITALAFIPTGNELVAGTSSGEVIHYKVPAKSIMPDTQPATPHEMPNPNSITNQQIADATEIEPNDSVIEAVNVHLPVRITGTIHNPESPADQDLYRFTAMTGQQLLVEVKAAQDKSPLDSIVEVLTADGQRILQTRLQAVRDSYFTFRGKDSDTVDDFRMFNWQEMDLNQYLYADGEVVRLWLYPRGPDSGYKVYPGFGKRFTYFGTTPTAHALQAPAFVVIPRQPGEQFADNGLPVFPIYFENDDDPLRQWGVDSRLFFTAPADGSYLVRITDARGFSGDAYRYQLTLRAPQPDFGVAVGGNKVKVHGQTGRELSFTATRTDGFDGPIELTIENLPEGFTTSLPTLIQQDQYQAFATILATDTTNQPSEEEIKKIRIVARGLVNGQEVMHEVGGLAELTVESNPGITVTIHSIDEAGVISVDHASEIVASAGKTTRAMLRVDRRGFDGNVEFGKEDAGRNLPHGVIVDNIGLNGLMLLPGQTEREMFITVAGWVPEMSRTFYLKSSVEGITSLPVVIHIQK